MFYLINNIYPTMQSIKGEVQKRLSPTQMLSIGIIALRVLVSAPPFKSQQYLYQPVRLLPLLPILLKLWNFKKLENQDKVEIVGLLLFIAADYKATGFDFCVRSIPICLHPDSYSFNITVTKLATKTMVLACMLIFNQLLVRIGLEFVRFISSELLSKLKKAKEKIQTKDEEISTLREKLQKASTELETKIIELNANVNSLTSQLQDKEREVENLKGNRSTLEKDSKKLREEMGYLTPILQRKSNEISGIGKEIVTKLSEKEEKSSGLEKQIHDLKNENKLALIEKDKKIEALEKQIHDLKNEVQANKLALIEKNKRIEALEKEKALIQSQLTNFKKLIT